MKTLMCTIFIVLTGTAFTQETKSKDLTKDYKSMAKEMCGCVNDNSSGLSKGMKKAIIEGAKKGNFEEIIQQQVMKDAEQGMRDVEALMYLSEQMGPCMSVVVTKYDYLYEQDGSEKAEAELDKVIVKKKSCDLCYALMIIGQLAEEAEMEGGDFQGE